MVKQSKIQRNSRDFKGVWIPAKIWLAENLSTQEKCFLAEIDSLDNAQGCFASNSYFSEFFGLSKSRCSEIISNLKNKGFISITFEYIENTKFVSKRIIRILPDQYGRAPSNPNDETDSESRTPHSDNQKGGSESRRIPSENTEDSNTPTNPFKEKDEDNNIGVDPLTQSVYDIIFKVAEKDKENGKKIFETYQFLNRANVKLPHIVEIVKFLSDRPELLVGQKINEQHDECLFMANNNKLYSYSKYFITGLAERVASSVGLKSGEETPSYKKAFGLKTLPPVTLHNFMEGY